MKTASLRTNYFFNLILTVSSLVFPLLSFKYVTGILQPAGTGKVSFAVSVVTYFNMFAQLGIPTYGIRAAAGLRDDRHSLSCLVTELTLLSLITAFISYFFLFLSVLLIPKLAAERLLYLAVSPMILLNAVGMEWLYKGLEEYRYIAVRSVIFKLIAFLGVILLVKKSSDYVVYGGLTVFASSASNLCNLINARKYVDFSREKPDLVRHIRPVLIFFAMSCAITVYTNLDVVMLGFMAGDTEVGYYDAAVKLKSVLVLMVTAFSSVVLPRASYYHEHGMRDEMNGLIRKSVKLAVSTSVPLTVFLMAYAPEGIRLISGAAYEPAAIPMRIIMPALILVGISNIFGMQVLVPAGQEKKVLVSVAAGAVTDAVLNVLLIPRYGASGAAAGTLAAEAVVLTLQGVCLREELKGFFAGLPFRKVAVSTAAALSAALAVRHLPCGSEVRIVIAAAVFGAVYCIIMFLSKAVTVGELKQ